MRRKEVIDDILRLTGAVKDYAEKADEIFKYRERILYDKELCEARGYAYHILPLSYLGTVYSVCEEELRKQTEWISDKRYGKDAWTKYWDKEDEIKEIYRKNAAEMFGCKLNDGILTRDCHGENVRGELPYAAYSRAILYCSDVYYIKNEGWVLKLSDPYGCFVSQPLKLSERRAKKYVGKMLSVVLHTVYQKNYEEKDFADFLSKAIEENDRLAPIYKRRVPVFRILNGKQYRQLEVSDIVLTVYSLIIKSKGKQKVLSPLEQYVKSFEGVTNEQGVISALDAIQKYVAKSDECTFNMRVSPTEYRLIMKNRTLYSFFWCNDTFCFSKEENHKFPTEREDRPARGDHILMEKAYDFNFREYAGVYCQADCMKFDIEYSDRLINGSAEKEMKDWQQFPTEGKLTRYLFKGKRTLMKIREFLLTEMDYYKNKFCDRWGYARLAAYFHDRPEMFNEDYNRNYTLCEHPEYNEKWKGTFFDRLGGGVVHNMLTAEGDEDVLKFRQGRQLVWHRYYLKNGAKSPFEHLKVFDIEWVKRQSYFDIDNDICIKYIGFCDCASNLDGNSTIHLVDPSGDAYFYNIDVPADVICESIGKMCTITCVYNYDEENRYRMLEFEILPFTLTEKLGGYPEDAVKVKRNLALRRRKY